MRIPVALLSLALAGTLVACGKSSPPADRSTPEAMARFAFAAMKDGDLARLRSTLLTGAQIKAVYERESRKLPAEDRKRWDEETAAHGGFDAVAKREADAAMANTTDARARAAQAFDWKAAEFDGIEPLAQQRTELGMKIASVRFRARVGAKTYTFSAHDATELDGQWSFARGVAWIGDLAAEKPEGPK